MSKYANGFYQLKNPQKYVGKGLPHYRSSWEFSVCAMCDNHPGIINWASEALHINYRNPFTGKNTIYVPDFFVMFVNASGTNHGEIWEVKPLKETSLQEAGKSPRAQAAAILNACKWAAARAYCKSQNLQFRILTENDIYHMGSKK